MSRFTAAGVPVSVLSTPTSFLYGAQASEGVAYIANADSVAEHVQISDSSGTPGHAVPINPGDWLLLPYGAYSTIKTIGGGLVYAQPGFLNKKRFLGLNSGDDIFNAETEDIVNAFTTPATIGRKHLINMTVGALKGFDLWNYILLCYCVTAETDQAARINWKNPGAATLVDVGTPVFNVDAGFTFGGGVTANNNSLSASVTVPIPAVGAINKFNISAFGWRFTSTAPNVQQNTVSSSSLLLHHSATTTHTLLFSANAAGYASDADRAHFYSSRRLESSIGLIMNTAIYQDGVRRLLSNNSPVFSTDIAVIAPRIGGSAAGSNQFDVGLGGIWGSHSDEEHLLMYQVWQAYLSIIGAI